jgi:hypothetical protein
MQRENNARRPAGVDDRGPLLAVLLDLAHQLRAEALHVLHAQQHVALARPVHDALEAELLDRASVVDFRIAAACARLGLIVGQLHVARRIAFGLAGGEGAGRGPAVADRHRLGDDLRAARDVAGERGVDFLARVAGQHQAAAGVQNLECHDASSGLGAMKYMLIAFGDGMTPDREALVLLAALLALAAVPSCSAVKPAATEQADEFKYGGYPDSRDRRECAREAEAVLERTGPTGDMYDDSRRRMRWDLIDQCMKKRGR